MTARRAAVLVVAVLVLLAGCTDGSGPAAPGGGSGGGGGADGGDGGGGSDGGDGTGTDGFAAADREQALREAGSFTATWRYSGTDYEGERGEMTVRHMVDLVGERSLTSWESSDGAETEGWQQFHADGVTYSRYGSGEETVYTSTAGDTDFVATSLAYGGLYDAADTDGLVARGQETFDGVPVTRYEFTEGTSLAWMAAAAGGAGGTDPEALRELDWTYTVLVDGDGLARQETWGWSGTTNDGRAVSFQAEYSITGVGSTAVADPAWLAAAEEASR
ncbi:DUF7537 family lipoprotein [Haloglomus litoreum]|uniref:DUF7537 family lipoprotein n=1 Tax=Haloglomus litoreum TaxID=3034026 RepID=UPI0023E84636|nr:hypothetical protein [Haloglomus sp. DT116]